MEDNTDRSTLDFLSSVRRRQESLLEYSLSEPPMNFKPIVDISVGLEKFDMEMPEILKTIKESGYVGVSLGCQTLKKIYDTDGKQGLVKLKDQIDSNGLRILAFHGGWDYTDQGLVQDFDVMKVLDPGNKVPVNYESIELDFPSLIAAYNKKEQLDHIRGSQKQKLGRNLDQQVKLIANGVQNARSESNSSRRILFEMPSGAFTAEGRPEQMARVVDILKEVLGEAEDYWGLTIDTGHLFGTEMNTKSNAASLQQRFGEMVVDIIEKNANRLGAIHIVGSLTAIESAYASKFSQVSGRPADAIAAIDMHGAPDSIAHLKLVDRIRKIVGKHPKTQVVEVAETGVFFSGLAGFGLQDPKDQKREYLNDILIQASLLGYKS